MAFAPSKYQQAIFDWVTTGQGSAVVEAVAGSGKTTTVVEAVKLIPRTKQVVLLAFNKSIATELSNRINQPNVECKTLNALGYAAIRRVIPGIQVDADKVSKSTRALAEAQTVTRNRDFIRKHGGLIMNLVCKAKVSGMAPAGAPEMRGLVQDTMEEWNAIVDHYSLNEDGVDIDTAIGFARELLLDAATNAVKTGVVDFDDQFWLPILMNAPFRNFDFIMVDEAQDVSDIQREILRRSMRRGSRLMAVGDPFQAIYGFRGANPKSIQLIKEQFNAVSLPLSISYRCAQSVVALAKTLVPHIETSEVAPAGEVTTLGLNYKAKDFSATDMVVCRNNAPLVVMAYKLIAQGVACTVRGRDIAAGLLSLIEKVSDGDMSMPIVAFLDDVDRWAAVQIERLTRKDPDADCSSIIDKVDCINAVHTGINAKTAGDIYRAVTNLFGTDKTDAQLKGMLTLSSIHKAKGLEADKVFILDAHLMPSKYAKADWELAQERNMQYVAITRAKGTLCFIQSAE